MHALSVSVQREVLEGSSDDVEAQHAIYHHGTGISIWMKQSEGRRHFLDGRGRFSAGCSGRVHHQHSLDVMMAMVASKETLMKVNVKVADNAATQSRCCCPASTSNFTHGSG